MRTTCIDAVIAEWINSVQIGRVRIHSHNIVKAM